MNQQELLKIIVCPICHGDLAAIDDGKGLLCAACQKVYPVRDDIPILLISEAVGKEQWQEEKSKCACS